MNAAYPQAGGRFHRCHAIRHHERAKRLPGGRDGWTGGRVDGWTARRELTGKAVWLSTCPPVYLSTLKQPDDLPARQPRHALCRRLFRQPGHGHDIPALGHDEPGTGRRAYLVDRDTESARAAELRGVVGERVLSLRNADRR